MGIRSNSSVSFNLKRAVFVFKVFLRANVKKRLAFNDSSDCDSATMSKVPTFDQFMNPVLNALRDLGGSGSIEEIYDRVIQQLRLSEDVLSELHGPEVNNGTEVQYRLGWARTYLKKYGAVTNSTRGVWSLTKPDLTSVDPKQVQRTVKELCRDDADIRIMNIEELKQFYSSDAAARVLCDHMASRKRNQSETKLERILALLDADDDNVKKSDLIAAFRKLGEIGCGQYIEGRHGWPSRFVWSVGSLSACQAASGETSIVEPLQAAADTTTEEESLTHSFNLRADLPISSCFRLT
jgi:hypothetical protein